MKKTAILTLISFFLCLSFVRADTLNINPKISSLTCNHQNDSVIMIADSPVFGWQIDAYENNIYQKAYNIQIYEINYTGQKLVWDSGLINSKQSQFVRYKGDESLNPKTVYGWRVKILDNNDKESDWSKLQIFRTVPSDLENDSKWIGAITKADSNIPEGRNYHGLSISTEEGQKWQNSHPLSKRSVYLRKEFTTERKIKDAILYISGLGHYELTLNGDKVGDAQFAPLWSDYDKTVYYNAYDVTEQIREENAIGVLLGNGFYNEQGGRYVKMQVSFGPPTLFFKLSITYNDGTVSEIVSDETWKYSESPITYNDMYGGENYDARLEQEGWDKFDFDDSLWKPVVIQEPPSGILTVQNAQPVKVMAEYKPVSVKAVDDVYVYDMGQNLSGFPRIKVSGKPGETIKITVSENIYENGTVNQSQSGAPYYYEYTLKGEGVETWQPRFTYYGYKYIQIEGAKPADSDDLNSVPEIHDITSCFVHNSVSQIGHFESSNEIFNKTHEIIVNAIKSNMHAVFTDCPHREKLGWLEQVHLNGPGLFYNFDLTRFAPKIMQDIKDAQLPNGLVPDIAPEYVVFVDGFRDSPEWGSTAVFLPFLYYKYYGDDSLIFEFYDVMKRYVDYLSGTANNHILSHGLGDWCDFRINEPYGVSKNTPVPLSASVHYYMTIDYLCKAAELTNKADDLKYYSSLKDDVKTAFNKEFFDPVTMQYGTGSQASNSMPLFAGLVEEQHKRAVLDNLIKNIEENGFRLTTGDVGNRYLFQTLAMNDLDEIMYKMHNHYEVPGYGFQLKFGVTTLTELWDPRDGASWNHFMMGQIEEWFYKSLAGINVEDNDYSGFQNLLIQPKPVGDLSYVNASHKTLYGKVTVDWKIADDIFHINVSIPGNSKGKIILPFSKKEMIVESGNYYFTDNLITN